MKCLFLPWFSPHWNVMFVFTLRKKLSLFVKNIICVKNEQYSCNKHYLHDISISKQLQRRKRIFQLQGGELEGNGCWAPAVLKVLFLNSDINHINCDWLWLWLWLINCDYLMYQINLIPKESFRLFSIYGSQWNKGILE